MNKEEILDKVDKLIVMYKMGKLGGEVMSEDANKHLEKRYKYKSIDIHAPLWLWSRDGFKEVK